MKETDLDRLVRSIGKSTFIRFYEDFRNLNISSQEMIDMLPAEYTLNLADLELQRLGASFEKVLKMKPSR